MKAEIDKIRENVSLAERYLKGMANQNRLLILCALMDREVSVGELNAEVDLSQSALSQHLAVLRELGFVSTRKEAQIVYYRVCDDKVRGLLSSLHQIFCDD